jgi:hypothetical protein
MMVFNWPHWQCGNLPIGPKVQRYFRDGSASVGLEL